jgi:hypothetical protein
MLARFLVVGLTTGCVVVKEPETVEPGTGEVEVSWQVASSGCEASGVTEVAVEIGGVGGSYDCAVARYGGESAAVTVIGGQTTRVPTVVMGALPASITASWSFDNGMLCAQNGVEQIDMIVYDNDFIEDESVAPCDSGELTIADIRAGEFVISLLGRDANQQVVYSGEAQVSLEKGDNEIVHVQLVPQ